MIWDCFTFFNELDLLEIRLHELDDVVDRFVLVEATRTFQGRPKPLHYGRARGRFAAFARRIVHVVVDDLPEPTDGDAWALEFRQRDAILRGLAGGSADDLVLISDVDEIPRAEAVRAAAARGGVSLFRQRMFTYWLNGLADRDAGGRPFAWSGTVAVPLARMHGPPQRMRDLSRSMARCFDPRWSTRLAWRARLARRSLMHGWRARFVHDGGWHFSWLGGTDRIVEKLGAFAHADLNVPKYNDPARIADVVARGDDLFGRGFRCRAVPIDESFPALVRREPERFAHLISGPLPRALPRSGASPREPLA